MGLLIYLFNQICGFQLLIMLSIYYGLTFKFPMITHGNYKITILVIIGLIWFVNIILIHLDAIMTTFVAIAILLTPFIFLGKLIFSGIKKLLNKSPYFNEKIKKFKLKRAE